MASAEDALRAEFALADLTDGDQLATCGRIGFALGDRRIAAAHEDRVAHLQAVRLVVVDDEMRQCGERLACGASALKVQARKFRSQALFPEGKQFLAPSY